MAPLNLSTRITNIFIRSVPYVITQIRTVSGDATADLLHGLSCQKEGLQ